jgi:site-specific DNA recombinase
VDDTDIPEYLLYLRKSNGRRAVPRQRAITTGYITKRGGRVLDEFPDADSTAYRKPGAEQPKRDEFARMLGVLRSRRGLRVAAWHADRLSRNQEDTAELTRVCVAGGHLVETPAGGIYDLSTASGRKRFRDDASDAEFEVDHSRERIMAQKDEAAGAGLWLGGRRPFGWETEPDPVDEEGNPRLDEDGDPLNGVLRLVPAEADALRKAHDDVLAGVTLAAVARQWNQAGLTGTSGGKWTGVEVRRVLLRPRNAGLQLHRGEVAGAAEAPAIVLEGTWRAVRDLLADPGRKTTTGPERVHLLSGLAVCGVCGRGLTSGQVSGKGRTARAVYRCRGAGKNGAHAARDASGLDGYVSDLIVERLSRADAAALLRPDTAAELAALGQEKTGIEAAMRESNDLRKAKLLSGAEFAEERAGHLRRLEEIGDAMGAASQADVVAPLVVRFRDDPRAKDHAGRLVVWEEYPLEVRRAVIDALVTIRLESAPKGRPKGWRPGAGYFDVDSVDIRWRRKLPGE